MKRHIYFKAFITPRGATPDNGPWPRYEWFQDVVDADRVDEVLSEIQIEHMANRLVGGWRHIVSFAVEWHLGDIYHPDYQI